MTGIVTLTMNPSIDTYLAAESFRSAKIRCKVTGAGPGGGGVNVARAIRQLDGVAVAALTVGGGHGERLLTLLDEHDVPHRDLWVKGETRDTYVIFEQESKHRYHILIEGPRLEQEEWQAALDLVRSLARPGLYLVLSGSLPPGVPDDFYAQVAELAKKGGSRVALDTSGAPLVAGLMAGVWLAKPNRNELETLVGRALPSFAERRAAAEQLAQQGSAEIVAATFGPDGSILATRDATWLAQAPPIQPQSEVGAGDSFVGALVLALSRGQELPEAAAYAVAAAGSALSCPGPGLTRKGQTEELYAWMMAREGVRLLDR